MTSPVFKIIPTTQQYEWGKIGKTSKVAQFAASSKLPGFSVNDAQPYAELWMGTHSKSPSRVSTTQQILSEHLKANPSLIGQKVINHFNAADGNLPFLFKVLSIEKALSIQTHPDKKTAEELHAKQPDIYKDPNHKPEMALAITPFRALCGFRPLPEIAAYLESTPELSSLIPPPILQTFSNVSGTSNSTIPEAKQTLKDVFSAVMATDESVIRQKLQSLVTRYEQGSTKGVQRDVVDLVLRLNSQFPGDVGVFCPFLLNYVQLKPGEAIFLGAGEPHAYVEGEIIECMANSDNVIRAGLTPKLRDIPNLVAYLTYTSAPPSEHVVEPAPFPTTKSSSSSSQTGNSLLYDPPISEFSVLQVKLSAGEREAHPRVEGPSIFVVTTGGGKVTWNQASGQGENSLDLGLGDVVFVGSGTDIEFAAGHGSGEGIVLYRSFVEAP